ncbi:lipopolysaccharide export system permease protein [Gammaproteobacteria bacterium]
MATSVNDYGPLLIAPMIIDRYIAREITHTLLAVFGILMVILISHQFVRYLADAAAGEVPGDMLLVLIGLKAISFAGLVLPLSLFLSVIIGLGRFYRDSEMVVMAACGIGPLQILKSVMRTAVMVGIVLAVLSLYFNPWAAEQKSRFLDQARAKPELSGITSGRFQESNRGETVYFAERLNPDGALENVFIQYRRSGGISGILAAARGHQEVDPHSGNRYLVLVDGHRYEEPAEGNEFRTMSYGRHGVAIPSPHVETGGRKREAMPTFQLLTSNLREDRAELQWRWSLPLSAILFAALGVPLSHSTPREGRYGKLFTGILVYLVFSNLLSVARNWMDRGTVPVELGLWWVHGLLLILVMVMMVGAKGLRTLRERLHPRKIFSPTAS